MTRKLEFKAAGASCIIMVMVRVPRALGNPILEDEEFNAALEKLKAALTVATEEALGRSEAAVVMQTLEKRSRR